MMRPVKTLPLELEVLKGLDCGGKRFARGDALPWQKLGLTERKARQLLEHRYLSVPKPAPQDQQAIYFVYE